MQKIFSSIEITNHLYNLSEFILRRDYTINSKYLPSRFEFMIFCKPSQLQITLYREVLKTYYSNIDEVSFALSSICLLKKICAHPFLVFNEKNTDLVSKKLKNLLPEDYLDKFNTLFNSFELSYHDINALCLKDSGKLEVLDSLLNSILKFHPSDKVIIVSNYTSNLDLIEIYLKIRSFKFLRLDGYLCY